MSESTCYYYDEQHNRCNCYVNKNLNELLDENAKLRELGEQYETVLADYRSEVAKLRDELAKWERLAAGIDLPEYPVTQFKSKDLERENAKLRELATRYDELQFGAVKAVTMPSDMGSVLREAADTILSLRDRAQDLQTENAKLREELESVGTAAYLYGRSDLKAENAKLRELVRNLLRVVPRDVSGVVIGAHGEHPTYYSFADAVRELGVEEKEL